MQASSNDPNDEVTPPSEDPPPGTPVVDSHTRSVPPDPNHQNGHESEITWPFQIKTVGYWRQFYVLVRYKNIPLLTRKPVHMLLMLLSSVGSVLLAWPTANDLPKDTIFPNVTECGAVPPDFINSLSYEDQDKVAFSLNDPWRAGLGVTVLCLGPMMTAICAYLIVHEEIQMQLFGVLRGLGMRDSVYWLSWYVPLAGISIVSSLLAAITAKTLPVHLFQATYFGGIFASFFFVKLALIAASFFLAAVSGTARRGSVWLILCMIIAVWIPLFVMNIQSYYVDTYTVTNYGSLWTPVGLFWANQETVYSEYRWDDEVGNSTQGLCNGPIMSHEEGNNFKTEAERKNVTPDQFFLGCFASAGWGSTIWSPTSTGSKVGTAALFFFPYVHFDSIWGNFAGFTGVPDLQFEAKHARMTSGELARAALPFPPNPEISLGTSLFPQGSMLLLTSVYTEECETFENGYCMKRKTNCPHYQMEGFDFCSSVEYDNCSVAPSPSLAEGLSALAMIALLFVLSIIYMIMAAYWGIVFVGGPGTHPFYFFLLPRYWLGFSRQANVSSQANHAFDDEEHGANQTNNDCVKIDSLKKFYKRVEALKGVSFRMALGEVTALLGHNGAGKTTLSNVLTCETPPTEGDINVFGYSVKNESDAIQQMVGVCKQDDYLWPCLTAKEHLDVFAGLRGVHADHHAQTVQKWLQSVDLETFQMQFTSEFSGGMKRRLSLALATIGGRPLIVLDEPTTGMDPLSRRFVWKHIDEIKQNRVVLLTTHAMEEADLLADTVAIMRRGELAALGTPLELKAAHGSELQFSILVPKEDTMTAAVFIRSHFEAVSKWITIIANETGNINVTILKIAKRVGGDGVGFDALSQFVAWLNDPKSNVLEYGFSNCSLEEVFINVTHGDVDDVAHAIPTRPQDEIVFANGPMRLASFTPKLTVFNQVRAIMWLKTIRAWSCGRRCLGNWLLFGSLLITNTAVATKLAAAYDKTPAFTIPVTFCSLILISICNAIYGDRGEGQFYLMRTHSLLSSSYLLGTGLYAFFVAFAYTTIMLSLQYATPMYRDPTLCSDTYDTGNNCEVDFGDNPIAQPQDIPISDVYNGQQVQLQAYSVPSGFGKVFAAGLVFAITFPGATFASSYFPGNKFALVAVAFLSLAASITPLVLYFVSPVRQSDEKLSDCFERLGYEACQLTFDMSTMNETFINCVGLFLQDSNLQTLCTPTYAGLLPQFGFFQSLSLSFISNVKFISDPPEYVENVLLPQLQGVRCSGNTCEVPLFATKLYGQTIAFEICGAVILTLVGVMLAILFTFPTPTVLHAKLMTEHAIKKARCRLTSELRDSASSSKQEPEFSEVVEERDYVDEIVRPLLATTATDSLKSQDQDGPKLENAAIPREAIPPILMHRLRKVYPSLGGLPPKVALHSLDLHVPKGQVLGLLGQNGSGKTTTLKILSCAHDATSGIGLVTGHDVSCDRISIFERLGNCPQFDVIWPKLTVKEHLLFFAKLKGIPRDKILSASHEIASIVGLGTDQVYNRQAGALSGGMRRRLSIAMALIGAPSVFLLDEPCTGLDPSTRNNIWGLVNSFATQDRAIIITTHMMIEADTLCNRIAIISKGKLVVVGTQQHLKDRFGSGFLLQLNLVKSSPEYIEEALSFVREHLHPDATMNNKQAKTLHVQLPRDLELTKAFSALYNPDTRPGCINQFLLSQSSLEDVFVALGDK